jgi:hypothetical protein
MALRLKMVVNTVKRSAAQDGSIMSEEITMSAVYSDKEGSPNKQWSKWTPAGNLSFTVSNPAAFEQVLPGKFFLVDLNECDKDAI